MNMITGFLGSYTVGTLPSRIPPCAGALAVLDAVAEAIVFVTISVIVLVSVAMVDDPRYTWPSRWGLGLLSM